MIARRVFVYLCLIIALLTGLIVRQRIQIKELESQIADTEHRLQVRSLVNELRVPPEAIYFDFKAMRQICEIRWQTLEKMQVKEFLPYRNVFGLPWGKVVVPGKDSNVLGVGNFARYTKSHSIYCPVAYLKHGATEATFEKFWYDRARRSIGSLKSDLENNVRLGKYYNEHPGEFDRVIKPWVLRLTRSTLVDTSLKACEVLLEKGHRDEEIKLAVRQVIERSPWKRFVDSRDVERAKGLSEQYKLGIDLGSDESGS